MIVAVDVDEVCAQLHTEWLHLYNEKYHDDLTPADFVAWDIEKIVKPECGSGVFAFLKDPSLYRSMKAYPGALMGVLRLRQLGHRVIFVTSCVEGSFDAKYRWLIRHGFLPDGRAGMRDFFPVSDKCLIRADVLVDDYQENLRHFSGLRLLVDRPHNRKADAESFDARVEDMEEACQMITAFQVGSELPLPVGRKEALHVA